jgi:hypothetical protein
MLQYGRGAAILRAPSALNNMLAGKNHDSSEGARSRRSLFPPAENMP